MRESVADGPRPHQIDPTGDCEVPRSGLGPSTCPLESKLQVQFQEACQEWCPAPCHFPAVYHFGTALPSPYSDHLLTFSLLVG